MSEQKELKHSVIKAMACTMSEYSMRDLSKLYGNLVLASSTFSSAINRWVYDGILTVHLGDYGIGRQYAVAPSLWVDVMREVDENDLVLLLEFFPAENEHCRHDIVLLVRAFQMGSEPLFLISLKAGGLGLNLTAADYVIHLDPWWNPAIEDQASDRAHRIGQDKPVTVYRLIAAGTIEDKIMRLHQHKRGMADALLQDANLFSQITADDVIRLLRERVEDIN